MKKILLSLSLMATAAAANAQCTELFISEYSEGSANSKALEFYNPTGASISMGNYRLVRYSNGSATGTDSTDLVGSIGSYTTFVIANGVGVTSGTTSTSPACDPSLQAKAQQLDGPYPAPTFVNGDDAMVLVRKSPYARIDIFGKIGQQPNTAWSDMAPYDGTPGAGKWWTKDHSLIRKASVKSGVMTNPSQFNVTLEWDSLPRDNWTNIGLHTCDCKPLGVKENSKLVNVKVFPNPNNGSEVAFLSDKNIKDITIINAIGQVVYTFISTNAENTVVLRNLGIPRGIYYTMVKNEVGTKTEKLIIQ